jgi:hypothetical protein
MPVDFPVANLNQALFTEKEHLGGQKTWQELEIFKKIFQIFSFFA